MGYDEKQKPIINKDIHNEGMSLMSAAADSDELEIFESENFQNLLLFKWWSFAKNLHLFGCLMHLVYVFIMILYIYNVYIMRDQESSRVYENLLAIAVIYPFCYDTT